MKKIIATLLATTLGSLTALSLAATTPTAPPAKNMTPVQTVSTAKHQMVKHHKVNGKKVHAKKHKISKKHAANHSNKTAKHHVKHHKVKRGAKVVHGDK
ncbi:hypothetical protein LVJ82_16760 [Vitreoscilla massiliensis]|uniref:Acid shock protein n=1 Tax=Vitreoscilla massiliensis TaxID=1689272 RepID=A0ABY4E0K2_9NEIS|nr:hypothetical protein [Vitreoscilla massiliensis]UOO89072.1 hypothetical protein LVJ82_16760 [Vitreoscilla massiliensis]